LPKFVEASFAGSQMMEIQSKRLWTTYTDYLKDRRSLHIYLKFTHLS